MKKMICSAANECTFTRCPHREEHDEIGACKLGCFHYEKAFCRRITNFTCTVHGEYNSYAHSSRGCPTCIAEGVTVEVIMGEGKSVPKIYNMKKVKKSLTHKIISYKRFESAEKLTKWQIENQDYIVLNINPDPHQYPWVFVTYTCNLYK